MELRQLKYFVAVAEELHFQRAAKRVGIEQSPLSQQIRNLEDELRVQLLLRTTRRTRLTWAGEVFLQDARRVLRTVEAMRRTAREAATGKRARVRVGVTEDVAAWRLAKVLAAFRVEMPGVDVDVVDVSGRGVLLSLNDGDVDLCFAAHSFADDDVECVELSREPLGVLLPEKHSLESKKAVRLSELRGERLILGKNDGFGWSSKVLSVLHNRGIPMDRIEHTEHAASAANLAAARHGVALLPSMEAQGLSGMGIVVRELADAVRVTTFVAIMRRAETSSIIQKVIERAQV